MSRHHALALAWVSAPSRIEGLQKKAQVSGRGSSKSPAGAIRAILGTLHSREAFRGMWRLAVEYARRPGCYPPGRSADAM